MLSVKRRLKKKTWKFIFTRILLPLLPLLFGFLFLVVVFVPLFGLLSSEGETVVTEGGYQNKELSPKVIGYESTVRAYAKEQGIESEVPFLLAIMETESHGEGSDPMQASESGGLPPNGITSVQNSIRQVVLYYKQIYMSAVSVGLGEDKRAIVQAYNFGSAYITWLPKAKKNHSIDVAEDYSRSVVAPSLGNSSGATYSYVNAVSTSFGKEYLYKNGGNFFYGELVFRYITTTTTSGQGGNAGMVETALKEQGNDGGQKFWSWYGYPGRVEWCATFVSWVANENGYIDSGAVPKFAYCPTGIEWFKSKDKWLPGGGTPNPGDIIFFDWEPDGVSDHVGIVVKVDGGKVHTIEGNTGDMVAQRQYELGSTMIVGYGQPAY